VSVRLLAVPACLLVLAFTAGEAAAEQPAHASSTCSDYSSQAEAQRAADTRDPDGDGVYCEALPCPCLKPGAGGGGGNPPQPKPTKPRKRTQTIHGRITKVIDGDTIRVKPLEKAKRRSYTVRLVGIDTPEKYGGLDCGALEATHNMVRMAFARREDTNGDGLFDRGVGRGQRVTLTTDTSQATFDRYDRLLAYARLRSGRQLQLSMLQLGWAKVYVFDGKPFKLTQRFRAASESARQAGRGAFGKCAGHFHQPIK
jgi:endonuclease YncB( thermonuclease family)